MRRAARTNTARALGLDLPRLGQARKSQRARAFSWHRKTWEVNQPAELANVLRTLEGARTAFNQAQRGGKMISLANLIVLGGSAGIERTARPDLA